MLLSCSIFAARMTTRLQRNTCMYIYSAIVDHLVIRAARLEQAGSRTKRSPIVVRRYVVHYYLAECNRDEVLDDAKHARLCPTIIIITITIFYSRQSISAIIAYQIFHNIAWHLDKVSNFSIINKKLRIDSQSASQYLISNIVIFNYVF